MRMTDRLLLLFAGAGAWALAAAMILAPSPGLGVNLHAREVDGLDGFVKSVVEGCRVNGQVTVVRDRGDLRDGRITC